MKGWWNVKFSFARFASDFGHVNPYNSVIYSRLYQILGQVSSNHGELL